MSEKNMADVADKAVDQLANLIGRLEKVAPDVWRGAVRAEVGFGIAQLVITALALGVTVWCAVRFVRIWRDICKTERDEADQKIGGAIVVGLVGVVAICAGTALLCGDAASSVARIAGPEIYAARSFVGLAK